MLDYSKYFDVEIRETSLPKTLQILVIPIVNTNPTDEVGVFIHKYKERFEYLIKNYWGTKRYNVDSEFDFQKVRKKYFQEVEKETQINYYLSFLISPAINSSIAEKVKFHLIELKRVASRFFFCKKASKNDTDGYFIRCYTCIGKNGQVEASFPQSYKLLEAISYEAIIKAVIETHGNAKFLQNLKSYLRSYQEVKPASEIDNYLTKVKQEVYRFMELNQSLEETLLNYYQLNKENIPIVII